MSGENKERDGEGKGKSEKDCQQASRPDRQIHSIGGVKQY